MSDEEILKAGWIEDMTRVVRGAGFFTSEVLLEESEGDGWTFVINVDEFTLYEYDDALGWSVFVWSGSYPFAESDQDCEMDVPTGEVASVLRYVRWLQKREAFYVERDEAMIDERGF